MLVLVNGKSHELPERCTVAQALAAVRTTAIPCAVELNERLVPHAERESAQVREGDRLEIVTLVGGG